MTNEQKIKAYLAAGHHVKVTIPQYVGIGCTGYIGNDTYTIIGIIDDKFICKCKFSVKEVHVSRYEEYTIEPLPLPPPPYKVGDKVIILDVAKQVANYSKWDQKKKDMVGKVFTIDSIDYCINIGLYSFPYFAVAPYFDDEKQTKIQELESQLATIAKELELLKK